MIEAILCGVLVGGSLGLTGGGGSIFAVPLLLYVLNVPLREAVAVSLVVVGLTALYGAVIQRRLVQWGAGGMLGAGGILGAPVGAMVGAILPELATLLLFAALMFFIGLKMWRNTGAQDVPLTAFSCRRDPDGVLRFHWPCAGKLVAAGAVTGILSGIFGVGGGFLVVPALLLVTAMPMDRALATSLVGIALISAAAFAANLFTLESFPGGLAAWFLVGSAIGMTGGASLKSRLPTPLLKKIFALAILGVALWILIQQALESRTSGPVASGETLSAMINQPNHPKL
ncbi:MAG: sulfite exporter TauE/SafE family protein [Terrimicrobiaceae bacterium]